MTDDAPPPRPQIALETLAETIELAQVTADVCAELAKAARDAGM